MPAEVTVFALGDVPDAAGFLAGGREKRLLSFTLPTETLKENLSKFLATLDVMLPQADAKAGGYHLDSFEVAVSINGKGEIGFLGTGGELGGSATLTLSFKR